MTDTAAPIVPCDHPNSRLSGSISTLGTDRKPAAPISAMKVTIATYHARCGPRRPAVGAGDAVGEDSDMPITLRRWEEGEKWQECHLFARIVPQTVA
ncbi:hypothetical protein GCM10027298_23650 [Epidermidibacterium keratini]